MAFEKKQNIRKKKVGNYPHLTVVFSISLSLFVIGLFSLLLIHGRKLTTVMKENITMNVFLQNNLDSARFENLKNALTNQPYVALEQGKSSIHYTSREDAAKKFIEETGEDFSQALKDLNPLRASFEIRLKENYFQSDKMKAIAEGIQKMEGVYEVTYPINLIDKINENITTISYVLIFFAAILIFSTFLLINNTIRLALYSQRFLIRSMQLVGATGFFIQKPFLVRSMIQGLISGIITTVILGLILYLSYQAVPPLKGLYDPMLMFLVFGGLLIFGMLIGLLSSYRAVSKYLKMSLDELY